MVNKSKNNWTNWHHKFHKEIINDKQFIPDRSHLLVSVSGGQDSMALLTLLNDIKEQHNWSLNIWHGDHRWHSKSRDFANKLKYYCLQKKLILHLDIANQIDVSSEEKARKWRYERLCETASEIIIKDQNINNLYILTGHTSTDNTETFILNLARGSSLSGLRGIAKKRLINKNYYLVRPFLIFSRNDTASICKELEIPFWEDPTNSDTKIKRNFVRHKIINELETIHPGCSYRINNFINTMRKLDEERSELCELAIKSCLCEEGIRRSIFNNLGEQTRSTILHFLLSQQCIKQISSKNIDNLSREISKKNYGQRNLPNGMKIIWNKNFVKILT